MKKYKAVSLAALTVLIVFAMGIVSAADTVNSRDNNCNINSTYNVVSTHYKCESWSDKQYPVIDLFGDKYVPLFNASENIWNAHVNKLAKLVLDSNETYTFKNGEELDLGNGYSLKAREIDIDNETVWLEFTKDGKFVANQNISVNTGENNKTWTITLDNTQGENNIVVMKVHVKQLFVGTEKRIVWIDGIWLIDYANIKTINIGDQVGEYTLTRTISGMDESNLSSLVFEKTPVADCSVSSNSGKGVTKFADKIIELPISWYWNFGKHTIKCK